MSERVRVVLFAPHFAEYSLRLAIALRRHGEVLLVLDGDNLDLECKASWVQEARAAGVRLLPYRYRSSLSRAFWFAAIMARALAFRPTILHVQEQADGSSARIVKALSKRLPTLLTVHDPKPHSGRDAERVQRMQAFRQTLRDAASMFHVHGHHCGEMMRDTLERPAEIVETPHGPVLCPDKDEMREGDGRRILFFGRMEYYKGLDVLLDASELLLARGKAHQLVLAGRGEELNRLGERLGAMAHVEVDKRFLSPAEAIQEIQKAGLLVAPYRDATQSGVVAAAYAGGRPVVASRVGGLMDSVIDDLTGLLTPAEDAPALADALERLIDNPALLERLAKGAVGAAQGNSGWASIAEILAAAYIRLANPSRSNAVAGQA